MEALLYQKQTPKDNLYFQLIVQFLFLTLLKMVCQVRLLRWGL